MKNEEDLKPEHIMERFIIYLYESITEMLLLIEEDKFEEAAIIRDEIDWKILTTAKYLEKNKLIKVNFDDLVDNFIELKRKSIKECTQMLGIPEEHHIL